MPVSQPGPVFRELPPKAARGRNLRGTWEATTSSSQRRGALSTRASARARISPPGWLALVFIGFCATCVCCLRPVQYLYPSPVTSGHKSFSSALPTTGWIIFHYTFLSAPLESCGKTPPCFMSSTPWTAPPKTDTPLGPGIFSGRDA